MQASANALPKQKYSKSLGGLDFSFYLCRRVLSEDGTQDILTLNSGSNCYNVKEESITLQIEAIRICVGFDVHEVWVVADLSRSTEGSAHSYLYRLVQASMLGNRRQLTTLLTL